MAGFLVGLYLLAQFDTVHLGHHHIGNHTVGQFLDDEFEPLQPVFGLKHSIFTPQNLSQIFAYLFVVFHHQEFVAEHRGGSLQRFFLYLLYKILQSGLHERGQAVFRGLGLHLLFLQIIVVQRQCDDKHRPTSRGIFYINAPVVYLHKAAGEVQPYARTHFIAVVLCRYLIEPIEYQFPLLGRDTLARVGDTDFQVAAVLPYLDCYLPALEGVFKRIGKDIEHYFVQFLLVNPNRGQAWLHMYLELYMLLLGDVVERQSYRPEERIDIGGHGQQPHLPAIEFPHFHHLVDQPQNALSVLVDHFIHILQRALGSLFNERLYGRENQGQRSSDFVRYIGEELKFGLHDEVVVLLLYIYFLAANTALHHIDKQAQCGQDTQEIECLCPPCEPKRGCHDNRQATLYRFGSRQESPHHKGICTVIQIGIGRQTATGRQGAPLGVEIVHLYLIDNLLGRIVFQGRKLDREAPYVVAYLYPLRRIDIAFQHSGLIIARLYFLVVEIEVGKHEVHQFVLGMKGKRIKRRKTDYPAEKHLARL